MVSSRRFARYYHEPLPPALGQVRGIGGLPSQHQPVGCIPSAAIDWTWSVAHPRSALGTRPICSGSFPHNTGPLALGSGCIAPPDHWLMACTAWFEPSSSFARGHKFCLTRSQCRLHKRGSGDLIGYLVLKKEVHYSNQDVKGLKSEHQDLKYM